MSQIQFLSVNTASESARELLSRKWHDVSILQIQIGRDVTLLLQFLMLNHATLRVLSIQHTAPQSERVDDWHRSLPMLGHALSATFLESLHIDIDDEDLTPRFLLDLTKLRHLKRLSLGEKQQKVISKDLESWPEGLHFPALEHLVLDVKKYIYVDKPGADASAKAKAPPNFGDLTWRSFGQSRYHDWMRDQVMAWGMRCPKLKWMLMYRVYYGGMAFSLA